jgi:hypothetical protein
MPLTESLLWFARDQIKVLGKFGPPYVKRCLAHWAKVYGRDVAIKVGNQLKADGK